MFHSTGVSNGGSLFVRTFVTSSCRRSNEERSTTGSQEGSSDRKEEPTHNGKEEPTHNGKEEPTHSEMDESEYEHSIRQRILHASLPHVLDLGWSRKALEAGAKDEGLPAVAHGMFPRGGAELVHYFYVKSNSDLVDILKAEVEKAKAEGLEKPKTKPFIRDAIEARLRMIVPYLDKWPQAMAISTLPQNAVESLSNLLNLADEIWYYAGDRSIDYNWYTKRMALAGVYKTSEIYMLQDKSPDHLDTWAFVDRRLEDLQTFGATKKSCEESGSILKESLVGFAIMGRNMLGINSRNRQA